MRTIEIGEHTLGSEHSDVAYPLNDLAELYREQGKYEQAKPLYLRALRIREQVLGPGHHLTRSTVKNYVLLLRTMKRESEADDLKARFPLES